MKLIIYGVKGKKKMFVAIELDREMKKHDLSEFEDDHRWKDLIV